VQAAGKENVQDRTKALSGKCGDLEITITAMSPLHFGQNMLKTNLQDPAGDFVHALCREHYKDKNGVEKNRIVLPGSSFKGMLRAVFEAVSPSCILFAPRNERLNLGYPFDNRFACTMRDQKVCPACSVFGALGMKGKLQFSSFVADERAETETLSIPSLQSPFRDYPRAGRSSFAVSRREGNERLYYGDFPDRKGTEIANLPKDDFFKRKGEKRGDSIRFYGRKFYKHAKEYEKGQNNTKKYECLSSGSILRGKIHYEGLTENEVAALAFSLGLGWGQPIYHKLGYAKPAYLGSIKIDCCACETKSRYVHLHGNMTTEELEKKAQRYKEDARADVKLAMEELLKVWSNLEGANQWKKPEEGGRNRMY